MKNLFMPLLAAHPVPHPVRRARALIAYLIFTLAMLQSLFAQASTPSFFIVDFQPVTKTLVVGSPAFQPLYDYSYRLQVSNPASAVSELGVTLASRATAVKVMDGQANFAAIAAAGSGTSVDIVTVRANKYFDRRLDAKKTSGALWRYVDPGLDPLDALVPGLRNDSLDWSEESSRAFYSTKLQSLLPASFMARSSAAAPSITTVTPQGSTKDASVLISADWRIGSKELDESNTRLHVDGVAVVDAQITATGLRFQTSSGLAEGWHVVTAQVQDVNGNLSRANWRFLVDRSAPSISNIFPRNLDNLTPLQGIGATFSDLVGVDTSRVVMLLDGVDVSKFASISATGIRMLPSSPLTLGVHRVSLTVVDQLGNSQQVEWEFGVSASGLDAIGISRKLPAEGSILSASSMPLISATLSSTTSSPVPSKTKLLLDGVDVSAQIVQSATSVQYQVSNPLSEGVHTVHLTVEDSQARISQSIWQFTTRSNPEITSVAPIGNAPPGMLAIRAQYSDVGAGIDPSKTVLIVDGVVQTARASVSASALTFAPPGMYPPGVHQASVTVFDKAGNSSTRSWSFSVDTAAPQISQQTPKDVQVPSAALVISANYQDIGSGIDLSRVKLWLDGVEVTAQAQIALDRISFTPSVALAVGAHNVKLQIKDLAGNQQESSWTFSIASNNTQPPVIADQYPRDIVFTTDLGLPTISASYSGEVAIDLNKVKLWFDGVDVSAQAEKSASGIRYSVLSAIANGPHTVKLQVTDQVGKQVESQWSFSTASVPSISGRTPLDVTLPNGSKPLIAAQYSDNAGSIDLSKVKMFVDQVDVTAQAQVSSTGISYTPSQAMADGDHSVLLIVGNNFGGHTQAAWSFSVLPLPKYTVTILSPAQNTEFDQPNIDILASAFGERTSVTGMQLNGNAMATTIDGTTINFIGRMQLQDGDNTVTVTANFANGESKSASTTLKYSAPPTISFTHPLDKTTLGAVNPNSPRDLSGNVERPVTITGRASKPVQSVTINQQAAILSAGGTEFSFPNFFLHEGTNLLNAIAKDAKGRTATASVTVSVDQTAPIISIEAPVADAVTSNAQIDVRGVVNDAVEGWANAPYPSVLVTNSSNGKSVPAKVGDRFYVAQDLPLEVGSNSVQITATDHVGNARNREVKIVRIASGSQRLTMLSGNRQRGALSTQLSKPLVVVALAKDGNPLANLLVNFDVQRGTGAISLNSGASGKDLQRNLQVRTDAAGRAQVWLSLGQQSGEAGNMVRASSVGISEDVVFSATGDKGQAAYVRADGGVNQYGETNAPAMEPLSAIVTDAQENRLADAPVTFTVETGDAAFAEGGNLLKTITVVSDRNGLATVRPQFGATPGAVNITAQTQNNLNPQAKVFGASFQITVLQQKTGATRFSGKVLNHTGVALAGVRVSLGRTSLSTTTDATGFFSFEDQVPPGKLDLFIDGRTANVASAQYPALHFEALAVRGQDNALPHPIYLPPLLMEGAKVVGGNQDVTLTIPGFEGFEMLVKANSVTFPDGSRVGPLVVSPVQQDKLPMVPPGGYSGFMAPAWTIQPTGTRFDPPIQVKIPNSVGLKAGETREIFQWDHDLATFVPMGRATVSEDAALLVTDQGSGVSKAGWGGPPNPPPAPPKCAQPSKPDEEKCEELVMRNGCQVKETFKPTITDIKAEEGDNLFKLENPWNYSPLVRDGKSFKVRATLDKGNPKYVKWTVASLTSKATGVKNEQPADKKGESFSFEVANVHSTTGSQSKSEAIQLTIKAEMCGQQKFAVFIQDEKDIIRQEYVDFKEKGVRHTRSNPSTPFSRAAPARGDFKAKGSYIGVANGLNNPYSTTLGDPYALANSVANSFNTRTKQKSREKFNAALAAATTPAAKAAIQAQMTQMEAGTFYPVLNSVWRSPRHNYSVDGAAGSNHLTGAAADLKPGNSRPSNVTITEAWCALRQAGGDSGASQVLLETNIPGGGVAHSDHDCNGGFSFNHVHVGNPG